MPRKYTEQDLLDAVYGFIKNREWQAKLKLYGNHENCNNANL
jgi:hypothetical protein